MKPYGKKIIALLTLSGIIVASLCGLAYAVSLQTQADICGRESFQANSGFIADEWRLFNFASQADANNVKLGPPLEVYWVDYTKYNPDIKLQDQAQQAGMYRYPVMVEDQPVCDYTIVLENGAWHLVDIGGNRTQIIQKVAAIHGFDIKKCREVGFANEVLILANQDGKEYAFSIADMPEAGLKANTPVTGQDLQAALAQYAKYYTEAFNTELQQQTYINGKPEKIGGLDPPIPYHSTAQASLDKRLNNCLEYLF